MDFELLVGLSVVGLMAGCLAEGTAFGAAITRSLDRVTTGLRANSEVLIRATLGFFLVSLWTLGGILLTPELKTTMWWVPWVQLGMATCLIWRKTLPVTALGIVVLFGLATWNYGAFHLADYPVFLGVAAYLALTALGRDFFGLRPLDVVRWAAGITLMWASVEKWAYPEWSFGLFAAHPALTLGFDSEFVMRAAGVIEFTLAFAIVWTPLVRRLAAIVLTGFFVSAIFEFGKVDAIGHAPIIVALLAIAADDAVGAVKTAARPVFAPLAYAAALVLFLAAYYGGHAALFGTQVL